MASIVAQYHRTLPTTPRDILTIPPKGPTRSNRKGWADQQKPHTHKPTIKITGTEPDRRQSISGFRLSRCAGHGYHILVATFGGEGVASLVAKLVVNRPISLTPTAVSVA